MKLHDRYYSQEPCDLCRRHAKHELRDDRGFVYVKLCPDHKFDTLALLYASDAYAEHVARDVVGLA